MSRRPATSIVASPVLVGAVTVLVTTVAVFLAYNANEGLPWVPSYKLKVHAPSAAKLYPGGEVRETGVRIGVVEEMRPVALEDGRAGAELTLKLEEDAGDVPVDSTFAVRPQSGLAGKYVELTRGTAEQTYADGGVVAAERVRLPVELDDVLSTFDARTRAGAQRSLTGAGNALAGRGLGLNQALSQLPRLLEVAEPVMANLAAPDTRLGRFFRESARTMRALAPVADVQARLFTTMADTWAALDRDPASLQAVFERAPGTFAEGESSLREQRPFLDRTAALMADLDPLTRDLESALPPLNGALAAGVPATRRTEAITDELEGSLDALGALTGDPDTLVGLRSLTALEGTLQPQLRFYGPHITVCNTFTTWFAVVAEVLSGPDPTGTLQKGLVNLADVQDDDLDTEGANEFATGRNPRPPGNSPDGTPTPQHLHADVFPPAISDDGRADCEYGQGGYVWGLNPDDNTPDKFYERAVIDTQLDPNQGGGPLYDTFDENGKGHGVFMRRVLEGMTYTRRPGGRAAPEYP